MSQLIPLSGPDAELRQDADSAQPLHDLRRCLARACTDCARVCSAFEIVWSIAIGFRESPRCLPCLSRGLGRDEGELRAQLTDYVYRRECYRRAWDEAVRLEGTELPPTNEIPSESPPEVTITPTKTSPAFESNWDAGDMACGELVLALRVRLAAIMHGTLLRVRATDPAAPEDIPAWCRLTGHALVAADHPFYFIRRKGA